MASPATGVLLEILVIRIAAVDTRAASLDKREAELNAREAALRAREDALRATSIIGLQRHWRHRFKKTPLKSSLVCFLGFVERSAIRSTVKYSQATRGFEPGFAVTSAMHVSRVTNGMTSNLFKETAHTTKTIPSDSHYGVTSLMDLAFFVHQGRCIKSAKISFSATKQW
jgi:hypothetical protein